MAFKERIVKFNDGTYGIQTKEKGWFFGPRFLVLSHGVYNLSWDLSEETFDTWCKGSFQQVNGLFQARNKADTPITFTPILDSNGD